MKCLMIIGAVTILSSPSYASMQDYDSFAAPVEYVKICSLYGAGYLYIPGTDVCVDLSTGITHYQTTVGTVSGQTQLAYRVSQLEKKLAMLMEGTVDQESQRSYR